MRLVGYLFVACVALAVIRVALALAAVLLVITLARALVLWPQETIAALTTACLLSALAAHPILFSITFAGFAGLGWARRSN